MGINIPIIDNWRIRSDSNQYMLVEVVGERETIKGYYSSLENCVQALIEKKIKGFNSTSIVGLLNSIKSLTTALNKAIQPLNLRVVGMDKEVGK